MAALGGNAAPLPYDCNDGGQHVQNIMAPRQNVSLQSTRKIMQWWILLFQQWLDLTKYIVIKHGNTNMEG